MIDEIKILLEKHLEWLRDKTSLRQASQEWVEITTPYLDRHNDCLQIYVKRQDNGFLLSDDRYVIEDLEAAGCKLDSKKRQDLLNMTLRGFGVQLVDSALQVRATPENFPIRKHNLIQVMLAVNDLFYLAVPMVSSLFYEDLVAWLDLNEVRYTPNVKFTGKSGFDHQFRFVIPKSKLRPERIIDMLPKPSRDRVEALAFKWIDTRETRPVDATAYAFLNDQDQEIPPSIVDALKNYDISPVLWRNREGVRSELLE